MGRWTHSVALFSGEVFTADEAAEVYDAYYQDDAVPDGYVLRELDI